MLCCAGPVTVCRACAVLCRAGHCLQGVCCALQGRSLSAGPVLCCAGPVTVCRTGQCLQDRSLFAGPVTVRRACVVLCGAGHCLQGLHCAVQGRSLSAGPVLCCAGLATVCRACAVLCRAGHSLQGRSQSAGPALCCKGPLSDHSLVSIEYCDPMPLLSLRLSPDSSGFPVSQCCCLNGFWSAPW